MGQNASSTAGGSSAATSSASSSQSYSQTQANGTGTAVQARRPAGTKVILNVYEQAQQSTFSMGIYHTGIEISGVEYSFAGSPEATGTGVMSQQPRATPADNQWKFKESIELGEVNLSNSDFDKILRELQAAFPANQYDLLHRNCNVFTKTVAKRLGVDKSYPSWVNRAATIGSWFVAPKVKLNKLDEPPPPPVSVFKATTGYRMDGSTVQPDKKAKDKDKGKASSSEAKKAEPAEQKRGGAAAAGAAGSSGRKNPWADPNFLPPSMRKDPVVATGKIDA